MDVFDRGKEMLVALREAIERAEPLIEVGATLMESAGGLVRETQQLVCDTRGLVTKASGTLERCDAILDEGPALAAQLGALMKAQTVLAELERERVARALEPGAGEPEHAE